MATTTIKELILSNEIKSLTEDPGLTAIQIGQNFDEIVAAVNKVIAYLNTNVVAIVESSSDFEANAITYGDEEPTD